MKTVANPSRRRKSRGVALVEFALSSTLLLLLAVGVTGFARIFNAASMAQGASEAGVQWGATSATNWGNITGMQTAALNDTGNYPGATAVATQFCTCSIGGTQTTCPASCGSSSTYQEYIQVQVTIPYNTVINFPWLPNPISITQTACARVQ